MESILRTPLATHPVCAPTRYYEEKASRSQAGCLFLSLCVCVQRISGTISLLSLVP